MSAHRLTALAAAGVLVLGTGAFAAQAKKPAAKAASAAKPASAAGACAVSETTAKPAKLAPPIHGEAQLGFTKPAVKRQPDELITTMKVKNLANGSIAGLRIEDIWYDKGGDPITGGECRYPRPLQPGEVLDITLRTHVVPKMDRNQYQFVHANGTIKPKPLTKLD